MVPEWVWGADRVQTYHPNFEIGERGGEGRGMGAGRERKKRRGGWRAEFRFPLDVNKLPKPSNPNVA